MQSRGKPGVSRCRGNVADAWRGRIPVEFCGKGGARLRQSVGAVFAFMPAEAGRNSFAPPMSRRPCPLSGCHPGPDAGSIGNPGRHDGSEWSRQAWSPAPPAPFLGRSAVQPPRSPGARSGNEWAPGHAMLARGDGLSVGRHHARRSALALPPLRRHPGLDPGSIGNPGMCNGPRRSRQARSLLRRPPRRIRLVVGGRQAPSSTPPRSCVHRSACPRGPCRAATVAAPAPP
jgi:hypothetical protein